MVDRRTRADLDRNSELVRDDVGQRGLAQAWWPAQQHVLHRLGAARRRVEEDGEVLAYLLLADVFRRVAGSQREVELLVVGPGVKDFVFRHLRPRDLSAVARASCVEGDVFQSTD